MSVETTEVKTAFLTVEHLGLLYADERWNGFGYLGERQSLLATKYVEYTKAELKKHVAWVRKADKVVLLHANANNWSFEDLFQFANSTNGRHYMDFMCGNTESVAMCWDKAMSSNLLVTYDSDGNRKS